MDLSGALVATRKKAKRRNGLFPQPNGTYRLHKKIKGHVYDMLLVVQNKADAREVADQVLKEIALGLHGGGQAPDLAAVIGSWCYLHRKQERHVKAARWAEEALGQVPKGATPLPKLPLPSITTERVDEWKATYLEDHAPATINLVQRYLKLWLKWAVERKSCCLPGMPCKIKMEKVEPRPRPVVKIADQDQFLQGIDCVKTWVRSWAGVRREDTAGVSLVLPIRPPAARAGRPPGFPAPAGG